MIDLEELHELIVADHMGSEGEPGFNTQILLRDGIGDVADVADGYEHFLVRQPGIERAEGIEREFWVVQSDLALEDVAAAAARALFELNQATR